MFFAGVLLGWMIEHRSHDVLAGSSASNETTIKTFRDRRIEPAQEAHSQKWQSLGKRAVTFSTEERESFLKELAADDRGKALDGLMTQAGPGYRSDPITSTMSEILKSWAATDVEGALSYCGKCANAGMRKFMLGQLIDILARKDPDRAISLFVEMSAEDPSFQPDGVFTLAQNKMGESAGQLLGFLSKLPMKAASSGTGADFSKDYDFEAAADGIAAMIKANPGKSPAVLPTNLMESWAARDPEAAHAWWAKNDSFEYNNWSMLLNGVEKHSTPEAAATWVVAKFEEPGAPREKMIRDLSIGSGGRAGRFNAIARAMPDSAAQDRFLTEAIMAISALTNLEGYAFAVSGLSSPQARLDAFQKIPPNNGIPDIYKIDDAQLNAWGITRQQMSQSFAPK